MAIVNIKVANDADFFRAFQYTTLDGTPIDLTGASMVMMLRRHASDQAALLKLSTDTGEINLIDPANGKFTILIRQASLERLGAGEYEHSNVVTQSGYKTNVWTGTFTNSPGAAR
jgi:hypothetical protein